MKKTALFTAMFISVLSTSLFSQEASISVGIVDFHVKNKSDEPAAKEAVSSLSSLLGKYRFISLVERSQLSAIMQEISLGQTGIIDENSAVKIGKISGVRVLIDGSVSAKGIAARAIYTETGRIIAVSSSSDYGTVARDLSRGIETYLAKETIRNLRNESPDISTEFWAELPRGKIQSGGGDKSGRARVGSVVSFHFKSDTDGYLSIVDIQPSGDVVLLFPNDFATDNAVKAGKECSVPSKDDTFDLALTEPSGTDTIVAFFTKKKVDWLDKDKLAGDGFKTVKDGEKFAATRAVTVQSKQLKKNEWESLVLTIEVEK
jgi:hypothetical protein